MKIAWIILTISVVLVSVLALVWIGNTPLPTPGDQSADLPTPLISTEVIRFGIIPERDIFAQRQRYLVLTEYIQQNLLQPTELFTDNSYLGILHDFENQGVDGAFMGSLVAVLAMDRYDAFVAVKPLTTDGISTYRGVIFVREDSPIKSVADLRGQSLATIRATTAGDLYPIFELKQQHLLHQNDTPTINWLGTHDAVIHAVVEGQFSAGAAKDLRIDAYLAQPDAVPLRRLAVGPAVPNNALVLASEMGENSRTLLTNLLLNMRNDEDGRVVLAALGFSQFVPCVPSEYEPIMEMIQAIGDDWPILEIEGLPPLTLPTN